MSADSQVVRGGVRDCIKDHAGVIITCREGRRKAQSQAQEQPQLWQQETEHSHGSACLVAGSGSSKTEFHCRALQFIYGGARAPG